MKYHWFHPCVPVIKQEAKYLSLTFGWLINLCGAIFIDRSSSKEAKRQLQENLERLKATSTSIIVFPEGTRNRSTESLLPFKKGAFHMAISAQVIESHMGIWEFILLPTLSTESKFSRVGCVPYECSFVFFSPRCPFCRSCSRTFRRFTRRKRSVSIVDELS